MLKELFFFVCMDFCKNWFYLEQLYPNHSKHKLQQICNQHNVTDRFNCNNNTFHYILWWCSADLSHGIKKKQFQIRKNQNAKKVQKKMVSESLKNKDSICTKKNQLINTVCSYWWWRSGVDSIYFKPFLFDGK